MGGLDRARDGGGKVTARYTLPAWVAALRGWGVAGPPKWPVQIELRDPGLLAVVRPRTFRSTDIAVMDITRVDLKINTAQFTKGGGFIGGGAGIVGAATGMAVAGALNRMSHTRWEETHLHLSETLPTGIVRDITFSFPTYTPDRLAEMLAPELDGWSSEWVRAALADEISPFPDPDDLSAVYRQIDALRDRQLLTTQDARKLSSHYSQPLLASLHTRLLSADLDHHEAREAAEELDRLLKSHRITRRQAAPLRALLDNVPSAEVRAERQVDRDQLIAELTALRASGAITEHELQNEIARLRHR